MYAKIYNSREEFENILLLMCCVIYRGDGEEIKFKNKSKCNSNMLLL